MQIKVIFSFLGVILAFPMTSGAVPADIKISDIHTGNYFSDSYEKWNSSCGINVNVKTDVSVRNITLTTITNPLSRVYCETEGDVITIQCQTDSAKKGCIAQNIRKKFRVLNESFVPFYASIDDDSVVKAEISFLPGGRFSLYRRIDAGELNASMGIFKHDKRTFKFADSNFSTKPLYFKGWAKVWQNSSYEQNCNEAKQVAIISANSTCKEFSASCKVVEQTVTSRDSNNNGCGSVVILSL